MRNQNRKIRQSKTESSFQKLSREIQQLIFRLEEQNAQLNVKYDQLETLMARRQKNKQ